MLMEGIKYISPECFHKERNSPAQFSCFNRLGRYRCRVDGSFTDQGDIDAGLTGLSQIREI